MSAHRRSGLFILALIMLTGCRADDAPYAPEYGQKLGPAVPVYRFGVLPMNNPERLLKTFGPLIEYLNHHVPGARFSLEASRDYAAFEARLRERYFHLALPNPLQVLISMKHGYRVFGKMDDEVRLRGIILVRADSNIRNVAQLKGKAVCFSFPTSLAASMLPLSYLHRHGIHMGRDIEVSYVGSPDSTIMDVYHGFSAACATAPRSWQAFVREQPEKARELRVIAETESLPRVGLVARDDVPPAIVAVVSRLLVSMHRDVEGDKILREMDMSYFEPATADTYRPVQEFIARFEREVRPAEQGCQP